MGLNGCSLSYSHPLKSGQRSTGRIGNWLHAFILWVSIRMHLWLGERKQESPHLPPPGTQWLEEAFKTTRIDVLTGQVKRPKPGGTKWQAEVCQSSQLYIY